MVYIIVLAAFILLGAAALRSGGEAGAGARKQASCAERLLDRMAAFVYRHLPRHGAKGASAGKSLSPGPEGIKLLLVVLFAGDVIALILWIGEGKEGAVVDGGYVLRAGQGEGSREVLLTAKREDGEELEASLVVQERRYGEDELNLLYGEMMEKVRREALADNASWDCVTGNLNFMENVEGYPFSLSWSSDNYALVTGSGRVAGWEDLEDVWEEETQTTVAISLRAEYFDFVRETVFYAKVCPVREETSFADRAAAALQEAEEAKPYDDRVYLPDRIDGEEVTWHEKTENTSRSIFLMSLLAAAASWILKGRNLQKQAQNRSSLMETEYPVVISKLTLYLGAGMNLKSAFGKTAMDGRTNPVYREMLVACREMDSGISEAEAYERFGKRTGQQRYIRLTTLLVQNLRKGNAALLLQLRQESFLALQERTGAVRKAGEEMGTKLLFPMLLMMGMVMVLIMVPAFLSF